MGEREGEKYSPCDSLGLKHCCYSRAWKEPFRWSHFCRHSVSQMLMKSVYFVVCFAPDVANSQTAFHIFCFCFHKLLFSFGNMFCVYIIQNIYDLCSKCYCVCLHLWVTVGKDLRYSTRHCG